MPNRILSFGVALTISLCLHSCGSPTERKIKQYEKNHITIIYSGDDFLICQKDGLLFIDNNKAVRPFLKEGESLHIKLYEVQTLGTIGSKQQTVSFPSVQGYTYNYEPIGDWGILFSMNTNQGDFTTLFSFESKEYYCTQLGGYSEGNKVCFNIPFYYDFSKIMSTLHDADPELLKTYRQYVEGRTTITIDKNGITQFVDDYIVFPRLKEVGAISIQSLYSNENTMRISSSISSKITDIQLTLDKQRKARQIAEYARQEQEEKKQIIDGKRNAVQYYDITRSYNNELRKNPYEGKQFIMSLDFDRIVRSDKNGFKYKLESWQWGPRFYVYTNDETFTRFTYPKDLYVNVRYDGRVDRNAIDITDLFVDHHRAEWVYFFVGSFYSE